MYYYHTVDSVLAELVYVELMSRYSLISQDKSKCSNYTKAEKEIWTSRIFIFIG